MSWYKIINKIWIELENILQYSYRIVPRFLLTCSHPPCHTPLVLPITNFFHCFFGRLKLTKKEIEESITSLKTVLDLNFWASMQLFHSETLPSHLNPIQTKILSNPRFSPSCPHGNDILGTSMKIRFQVILNIHNIHDL